MLPTIAFNNAIGKLQDDEDRIPSQQADDVRILSNKKYGKERILPEETEEDPICSNKKHGKDRATPKQQETEDNDEDQISSNKNESEDQMLPNNRKKSNRQETFQGPYAAVCAFDDTNVIALIKKRNYKVPITIGLISLRMRPANCVYDNGDGPSLLHKDIVEPDWMSAIHICQEPRLRSATNKKLEVFSTKMLRISMGESLVRVKFGTVKNSGVPVFLLTSFFQKFV